MCTWMAPYRWFVGHPDIWESFPAACGICRPCKLQKALSLYCLNVGTCRVPRSDLHFVIHLQLHFFIIVFLRGKQKLLSIASILKASHKQQTSITLCNTDFIVLIFQYISDTMQHYTVYFIWKLLYMFPVVTPPIIRSAYNCIYSIWYLSHRYCYLPLSWKSWNWIECAGGWHTPPTAHSNQFQLFHDSADSSNGVTNTRCCRQLYALLMMDGGTTWNM